MTRLILLFVTLMVGLLGFNGSASAALRAPGLQTPANKASGHTFPVFTWKAVKSAATYEIAISADKRFGSIVTGSTMKSRNTAATLSSSLADGTYFWRVRAISASGKAGRWSAVREYAKVWQDAPELTAPANELSVQWPGLPLTLRWTPVPRATKYLVTVATDPSLAQPVIKPIETQGTVLTVPGALAGGRYYWAVQPIDAGGFKGRRSRVGAFTWTWSSATQVSVDDVDARPEVVEPFVRWTPVAGAAAYQVEINSTAEFAGGSKVFETETVATSVSSRDPLPNNTYYVRVRAIDPNGNAGGWVTASALKRFVPSVTNLRVGDNIADSIAPSTPNSKPLIAWDPIPGAAGYTLQVSPWTGTACNWSAQTVFWDTPNAAWTPTHAVSGRANKPDSWNITEAKNPFADGVSYCVRVRAFQSDKTLGGWTEMKPGFTYDAPDYSGMPAASCNSLASAGSYRGPVGGVVPRTPVFRWNDAANARGYWIVIAKDPDFTTIVESAWTSAPVYASPRLTYSDETTAYYWSVMPGQYVNGGCVTGNPYDADFGPQAFGKRSTPPSLLTPGAGEEIWTQPTFRWTSAEGASIYRLEVDSDPSFSSPIEAVETASTTYTTGVAYPVDSVLYWRVRAIDHRKLALNWSSTGTFRRRLPAPAMRANPSAGEVIPSLDWDPVLGAVGYDVHVDQSDGTGKDFTVTSSAFTPIVWYGTGVWRWKVRARFPSARRGVVTGPWGAEQSYVRRLNAPGRPRIVYTKGRLYFTWDADQAAAEYRLEVSRTDSFTRSVDSVKTTQTSWAPLLTKRDYLDGGKLYWRLANVDAGGNVGAYSLGNFQLPKALKVTVQRVRLRKGARAKLLVTVTDPNKKRVYKASVRASGAGLKMIKKRTGKKGTVTFAIRPRKKGTVVLKASRSGYREGELRLSVR